MLTKPNEERSFLATSLVLPRVVGDLHSVHLQAMEALAHVVDPGDVGAFLIDHLHHLHQTRKRSGTFNRRGLFLLTFSDLLD